MARESKQGKRTVRGRSGAGSKKVLRRKEPSRVKNQPESDSEVRNPKVGVQGINQVWSDIAVGLYLNSMSFSVGQAVSVGMTKENIAQIGLSYFVRLYDSLAEDKTTEQRRQRLTEILDLYFLAGTEVGGAA